jgi:hypothetical protein
VAVTSVVASAAVTSVEAAASVAVVTAADADKHHCRMPETGALYPGRVVCPLLFGAPDSAAFREVKADPCLQCPIERSEASS